MGDYDTSAFEDIRAYHDEEVRPALDRLIEDDEFISAIIDLRIKKRSKLMKALAYPFVRQRMRRILRGIHDVYGVQTLVRDFMRRMIARSTAGFTVSGLDGLDREKTYLFISNHRDIVLDPAMVSYSLYNNGYKTVRIAIGDNLQSKDFITDLMKLNKSFIVKRSVKGPREMLANFKTLSAYISKSLNEDQESVWIAQGEGRAKDGKDITQPAIIKMITMSKGRQESFEEFINGLHIVPVSISYEYDPCDGAKARELYLRERDGSYKKGPQEDFQSITKGITGYKGKIHLHFGEVIAGSYSNPTEVAQEIDRQIISNYKSYQSNQDAYDMMYQGAAMSADTPVGQRILDMPEEHRSFALAMYANVIQLKNELEKNQELSKS